MSVVLSRVDHLRKLRDLFALYPEPEANNSAAATVKFHLPSGLKSSRRFMKTDTIQVSLIDYHIDNNDGVTDCTHKNSFNVM